ncbi:tRNA (adenosine(37)-N6)-threonylcarbamoyltransferase complex dimerization subunit type 1 TsaB [Clostridium sp. MSJ-11]|uniref:tRNA (Adenosine(37)-N6)-threonylcarbamoyltransferase complex dimerization subunit type 1 TsaB n=1 Tax=Clostridium mobile TaxID=2841512 RepID=A0ABS6EJW3_9CLOT|nr:tRNA (adenosine(37)-N6)-threonylcarbamoyltransferase complex dimerization subunit type 1 TsaB [Clostridium mobile]MBU5485300.1 tRNA (adenosine(37)-N6)-threonylcarbamoyltransferase complex dimerization subunit type 1 TsaB [Clostridium mobile]
MKILSLDSATECATCAILDENKLLGEVVFNYKKQHSIILMPMIDYLLKNLNLTIQDIDGFVVSKGPGSFTGLRIGAATIKGLSEGTGKPFVSVSSLDGLAFNLAYTDGIICPILDALRDNVYTCLYRFNDGVLECLIDYSAISIEELISILNTYDEKITFIGDCTEKFKDKLNTSLKNIYFAPSSLNVVKASSLGDIGLNLIKSDISEDIHTFAPIYLRKSQAEREYENKNGL